MSTAVITGTWSLDGKETFVIEHNKIFDVEELVIAYSALASAASNQKAIKGMNYKKVYQIGTMNFETVNSREITLSVVQNYQGKSFAIKRFGPGANKYSCETFQTDESNSKLRVKFEFFDGLVIRFSEKSFVRVATEQKFLPESEFRNSERTLGWNFFEVWPASVLEQVQLNVVKAVKIKIQTKDERSEIMDTIWANHSLSEDCPENINALVDLSTITRYFGNRMSEGEEIITYTILVR